MSQMKGTWDVLGLYMFASVICLFLKVPFKKRILPCSSIRVSDIWIGVFLERSMETPLDFVVGDVA